MKIRRMVKKDIPELTLLYKQFWDEDSPIKLMEKKFTELRENPNYVFISALEKNHLIGSVSGIICEELYGECKPFLVIENLIVDQKYRRKGTGKALMNEIEKIATERGCYQILLITHNDRTDAIAFYESLGFNQSTHKGFKKPLKQ
ncbi:GNAT family N-acetyltransferase [Methanobacterium sp.]|uniref:GNAT family N-acetyltransferase n=1 Tax=Methanobacterium sp. TaxID=2164 RepID=UPI003C737BBC